MAEQRGGRFPAGGLEQEDETREPLLTCEPSKDVLPSVKPFSLKNFIEKGHEQAARDNMQALRPTDALCTAFKPGTVLTLDPSAVRHCVFMCSAALATCSLAVWICAGDLSYLAELEVHQMQLAIRRITFYVPLALALYVSLSLERWWSMRTEALERVHDALVNICSVLACGLPQREWQEVQTQVCKWGIAALELVVQAAHQQPDLARLVHNGVLNALEVDALQKSNMHQRPMILWSWIPRCSMKAMEMYSPKGSHSAAVMQNCINATEGLSLVTCLADSQLPFAYVHLVTLLVNVQSLATALKTGIVMAKSLASGNTVQVFSEALGCLLMSLFLQAVLQVTLLFADPLTYNPSTNFPLRTYISRVAASMHAICEANAGCALIDQDGQLYRSRHISERFEADCDGAEPSWARQQSPASSSAEMRYSSGGRYPSEGGGSWHTRYPSGGRYPSEGGSSWQEPTPGAEPPDGQHPGHARHLRQHGGARAGPPAEPPSGHLLSL